MKERIEKSEKEHPIEAEQPGEQPNSEDAGGNFLNFGKKKGYYFPPEDSEYSPFENWTKACFAILQAKHRFTKESFNDLVTVLIHPSFVLGQIPNNYDQLKSTMRSLPLLPYHEITVSLFSFFFFLFPHPRSNSLETKKKKKFPSSSKRKKDKTTKVYHFDVKALLTRMLNHPNRKFFKNPVKPTQASEYWHGRLFRESPLFNNLSPHKTENGSNLSLFYFVHL